MPTGVLHTLTLRIRENTQSKAM